jgi:hypothetical protein
MRKRVVPAADLALSTEKLHQQVLLDRTAIAQRDAEIQRLHLQVLGVSADM